MDYKQIFSTIQMLRTIESSWSVSPEEVPSQVTAMPVGSLTSSRIVSCRLWPVDSTASFLNPSRQDCAAVYILQACNVQHCRSRLILSQSIQNLCIGLHCRSPIMRGIALLRCFLSCVDSLLLLLSKSWRSLQICCWASVESAVCKLTHQAPGQTKWYHYAANISKLPQRYATKCISSSIPRKDSLKLGLGLKLCLKISVSSLPSTKGTFHHVWHQGIAIRINSRAVQKSLNS